MSKKKKNQVVTSSPKPGASFLEIFKERIDWMIENLPSRLDGHKAAQIFLREFSGACGELVPAIEQGDTPNSQNLLPFLLCIGMGFVDARQTVQGHKKAKKKIAEAIVHLITVLHERQHILWNNAIKENSFLSPNCFNRQSIKDFCLHEKKEAIHVWQREQRRDAGIAGIFYHVCAKIAVSFQHVHVSDDRYVTELPHKTCPNCYYHLAPTIDRTVPIDPENGRMFVCPMCGYKYGYGGLVKRIFNGDGQRMHSTQWTVERMGVDSCQLCGLTRKELMMKDEGLASHHKQPLSEGGEDTPSNILVVCTSCHRAIHQKRDEMHKIFAAINKAV